jgi:hypothetical protein
VILAILLQLGSMLVTYLIVLVQFAMSGKALQDDDVTMASTSSE